MLEILINKVMLMLLFMSILNIIRHSYYFIQAWVKSDTETPQKYLLNNSSLWLLSLSIGYTLVAIFSGVHI
jgi:hypothetical protein